MGITKWALTVSCVFGLILSISKAGIDVDSDNLIPNPGFEKTREGEPVGWHKKHNGRWSIGEGVSGTKALRLSIPTDEPDISDKKRVKSGAYSAYFSVKGDQWYLVSFRARSKNLDQNKFMVHAGFKKADGSWIDHNRRGSWKIHGKAQGESRWGGDWHKAMKLIKTPSGAAEGVISIRLDTRGGSPVAWFDNFAFKALQSLEATGEK